MTDDQQIDALTARACRGDREAFAALYDALAPRVLRYFRHQAADDSAEDLMQRTFLKVIEGLPTYEQRPGVPFTAWVFRVARNLLIDERRRARPVLPLEAIAERPADDGDLLFERAVAAIDRDAVRAALDRLDDDAREVLLLRFFGGLTSIEAGAVMHRSAGAVRVLQFRALAELRRELATAAAFVGTPEPAGVASSPAQPEVPA